MNLSLPSSSRLLARLALVAATAVLGACAHKHHEQTAADATAPMAQEEGGKFAAPKVTGQGAPSLASVPNEAPKPSSTKQEREKTVEGLIADRDRARYIEGGGRTMPVAVRPLSEAAAQPDEEPTTPPVPRAAKTGSVTKLGNPPPPAQQAKATPAEPPAADESAKANVDAAAQIAATAAPPPRPADMEGPRPSAMPAVRTDGFKSLGVYTASTSQSNLVASVDFSGTGTSISAVGRRALRDAAQQGEHSKGNFRVIGRSAQPSNITQDRATAVARELQRLGVTQDRIYVGADTGQDGRVDVILDQ